LSIARTTSKESFNIVFYSPEASETDHFVARQAELAAMHKTLSEGTGRRAVTLYGLGGIGKIQLAITYAKVHRDNYSAIFWVNIKDEVSVKQSYSRLARRILQEHPSASELGAIIDNSKPDEVVVAVKR
jgi:ATP/maltotriose-dependent transcriptional regulator MalT